MIGQSFGHYTILEKIGAGGMGHVYRARDMRLERDVAIKVLPPGSLADPSTRKRFRQEALSLSKLNHPNVATVHDFNTQNDVDFLVMEYIPGKTLAAVIGSVGLPEKQITNFGMQIAEGLSAAHEQGILHRDLKPSNVLVTQDGRAKICDFGLAKLLEPLGDSDSTDSHLHSAAGTLTYMAPEQLLGEKLDARTDVYALGEVLYEMATGVRPFKDTQSTRLTDAILHQPAVPARTLNPKISAGLEFIIEKCLEKDPANRYQSTAEAGVDLRRLSTSSSFIPTADRRPGRIWLWTRAALIIAGLIGLIVVFRPKPPVVIDTAAPRIGSIAVLPLENLTGDAAQDYFAAGMTEELINNLSKVASLRVISRTSTMQYKGAHKALPEIARALQVDAIVEGAVQRSGDRVHITTQLIAANDQSLWSNSYDRDVRDVLSVQGEVAGAIAKQIQLNVTPREQQALSRPRPVDPVAYELYLQGRYLWNKRNTTDVNKALALYRKALERDPNNALAYSGIAQSYMTLGPTLQALPPQEAIVEARKAALKAMELDPELAEPHVTLSQISLTDRWDWQTAQSEIQKAIELNPGSSAARHWYGFLLAYQGKAAEARRQIVQARDSDPLSPILQNNVGWTYYIEGDYEHAMQELLRTEQANPDFSQTRLGLGSIYLRKGESQKAIQEMKKGVELSGDDPGAISSLAYAYARTGDFKQARSLLEQLKESWSKKHVAAWDVAIVYAGLGDHDQALTWLERAAAEHSQALLRIKIEPWLAPLYQEPRFQALVRKMNLG
jgi:TolB-like protein/Flp pilus assembly protein TadD/tRNA A-37 threonylcarbamoyl transferase component Bud32